MSSKLTKKIPLDKFEILEEKLIDKIINVKTGFVSQINEIQNLS